MGERRTALVLMLILCFAINTLPLVRASPEMWSQTYGGEFIDHATSLVETSDGGYALAGVASFTVGFGLSNFLLIKTDAHGVMVWNQTYEGEAAYAHELVETSDGGYALAGTLRTAENFEFWLVKTDAYGNMLWNQTYGGPDIDQALAVVQSSDGGYVLAGYTESFGSGPYDCWLIKTDEVGNMIWNKTYGGEEGEVASSLVETSDGGFALAGQISGVNGFDFLLIKTDFSGNMEWNHTFGGIGWDQAYSLVETSDGGFALAGRTFSFGAGSYDAWLVKTDANGNMEWNQTYGGSDWDEAQSLVVTSDGGYALAGTKNDDFWLVKTDEYGVPEFPSWIPLLITLIVGVIMMVIYRCSLSMNQGRSKY